MEKLFEIKNTLEWHLQEAKSGLIDDPVDKEDDFTNAVAEGRVDAFTKAIAIIGGALQ